MNLTRIDLTQNPPAVAADAPPFVSGVLSLPSSTWPDLTEHGYPGVGYWPIVTETPTYDPATQVLGAPTQTVDAVNKQVISTPSVLAAPPPPVPQSVSRAQALAALSNAGLLTQAQNAANASTNPLVPIFWNNAQTFDRNSATVATLGGALGLTDAQIDSLFIAASTITA
jgi:hypothetical protein